MAQPVSEGSEKRKSIDEKKIKSHQSPIFQTSVYDYPDLESLDDYYEGRLQGEYIYSRNGLPNSTELGALVATLEEAEAGVVCSSGMGAIFVALLSTLKAGDQIVASNDLYGGTTSLLREELPRFQIKTSFVDSQSQEGVVAALKNGGKFVVVETISNPMMRVSDIEQICKISHETGALVLVDNTFATPFIVRPVQLGADVVMHSGTKYLGGHDDLTIGVLCGTRVWITRAGQFTTRSGMIAGPFDSWLATRSVHTWELRVRQSSQNALKLARYLESRTDKISKVYYPGLESHLQHRLAERMFANDSYGGMLSFDLRGGFSQASRFVRALKKITLTPSLGGVSTAISHPGKTSHRFLSQEEKAKLGITDAMIRVSVGIEEYGSIEDKFRLALDSS